jgi:hypothetical protein
MKIEEGKTYKFKKVIKKEFINYIVISTSASIGGMKNLIVFLDVFAEEDEIKTQLHSSTFFSCKVEKISICETSVIILPEKNSVKVIK